MASMQNDESTLPPSSDSLRSSPFTHIELTARAPFEQDMIVPEVEYWTDPMATITSRYIMKERLLRYIARMEQRLIARWKEHLQWQPTLQVCEAQNVLASEHWCSAFTTTTPMVVKDLIITIIKDLTALGFDLYNNHHNSNHNPQVTLKSILLDFLSRTPPGDQPGQASDHLLYFTNSAAPQALVMLYTSSHQPNSDLANDAIREFILQSSNYEDRLPNYKHSLALLFSKWLGWAAGIYDPLYVFCCSNLNNYKKKNGLRELANRLLHDLELSKEKSVSSYVGPALRDVKDLAAFLVLLKNEIMAVRGGPVDQMLPLSEEELHRLPMSYAEEITCLHQVFLELLHKLEECFLRIEEEQVDGGMKQADGQTECCHYLAILKELNTISKLYQGAQEVFRETMKQRKAALCYLIVRFVKRIDDHKWILEAKEATNFKTRRHLAMMMFPEVDGKGEYEEPMLIDRSHLFAESFECIARADPESLRAGLFMEFKYEIAAGPGVEREWFYLVCQAIFSSQNTLFLACPKDRRRFFPNPASKGEPLHLEYFGFAGRIIALALVHKVEVGILFDRVFLLQLAGYSISIEDIRDADPYLFSSCKKILEMDPEVVDQDVLGLTFVDEVEEFGIRKGVELCTDGRSVVVNSKNRKQYVDSLIQHRFVTAVGEQIAHFAQGFADIMSDGSLQRSFFQCLEQEDLDRMLYGSESAISIDDWMAHTEYHGFKATDCQISWFWKVVECMSTEKKKALLYFWTSIRHLPAEGLNGLPSRLCISRTPESFNHLPSSATCSHQLCLPAYPSEAMMRDRLQIITQEHVAFSFGDD